MLDYDEATFSFEGERHGILNKPNAEQMRNIQGAASAFLAVRALFRSGEIRINSWFRNPAVNGIVGGAENSAHLQGWAIDFKAPPVPLVSVCQRIITAQITFDQLILEYKWVHISFSPRRRMQILTKLSRDSTYLTGLVT